LSEAIDQYFSKTIEKGLRIISLFHQGRPSLSQTEVSQLTGINMTSTFRFVNTLVHLGYLRKDRETKRLTPGTKAIALAYNLLRCSDFIQTVKPMVDDFHERHNVTVDVALVDEDSMLIVYRREAAETLTYRLSTMHREIHSTSLGKAYLANLPPEELEQALERISLVRRTPKTIISKEDLLRELEATRQRGYARSNEEYLPGLITLGAPLIHPDSLHPVGSISFDFSTAQQSLDSIEKSYAEQIVKLAQELSRVIPVMSERV